MVKISLKDFVRSGRFGPVALGQSRAELREATIVRTKSGIEFAFEADFHNPAGPPVLGAISPAWEA